MRTVLRQYPDGEVIALFPEEPASEDGTHCMAWLQTGHFIPVIAEEVMKNTKPAKDDGPVKRALRKMEKHRRLPKFERKPQIVGTKLTVGKQKKLEGEDFRVRLAENQWMMR